jgi:hypothetical protein
MKKNASAPRIKNPPTIPAAIPPTAAGETPFNSDVTVVVESSVDVVFAVVVDLDTVLYKSENITEGIQLDIEEVQSLYPS